MEGIIDIQLVKEQLRLLGHDVADEVIIDFVKGLSKTAAACEADQHVGAAYDPADAAAAACDAAAVRDEAAVGGVAHSKGSSKKADGPRKPQQVTALRLHMQDADAAPSKVQQAPDQQSPKRLVGAGTAAALAGDSPPPPSMSQRAAALDQRCRSFLSRCAANAPSPEQQQEASPQPATAKQPILLHVPQLQQGRFVGGNSGEQLSSSGSSQLLLLDDTGSEGSSVLEDSLDSEDSLPYQQSSGHLLSQADPQQLAAAARWAAQQPQPQCQHWQAQLLAETAGEGSCSGSDDDGTGVDTEGGKFLEQQVTAMQRVRARLTAKLSRDAAEAGQCHPQQQQQQQPVYPSGGQATSALYSNPSGAAALAAAARLGGPSSIASDVVQATEGSNSSSSSELPRFGFRAGYKPIGVHMPPAPSAAAVEALTAARALRQQAVTQAGPAVTAEQDCAVPAHLGPAMPAAASSSLHEQQQQQEQQQQARRVPALQLPAGLSSSGILRGSPTQCKVAAGGGSRSVGSIIGGESSCMAGGASKARQSPRVDPMYLAPSSPKRSSPATPRSPARSPIPAASLSAAAVRLHLTRGPAGTAQPAEATRGVPVRRTSCGSANSRQEAAAPAGSRTMHGVHQHLHQQQQQQQQGGAGVRRTVSAPATHAGASARTASRPATAGIGGGTCRSSRRSTVSQESLYCQRLACGSQRGTVAPGVRKTDRVARFQQMQQQWQRDRFLCSGAGGAQKPTSS